MEEMKHELIRIIRVFALPLFLILCSDVHAQNLNRPIPDKVVVLTFDDAAASHYSVAAPLLKRYGFGATFFVCEFPPNFRDSSLYMNWRQIKVLGNMGFEIANHTLSHPLLTKLSHDQIDHQIGTIENKFDSMEIGHPVSFAYPASVWNDTVLSVVKERGYHFARIGGDRTYDPSKDPALLIPSWVMTDSTRPHIMNALKEAKDGKIVVLTIHGVPDAEHPWVTTSSELFGEYMQYLADNHYEVIAMRDLEKYIHPAGTYPHGKNK
jgi:peptidoglycan/xylan/chitin deacetylase (PgdA/CDA1 family)